MKQIISAYERDILDAMAVALDQLEQAKRSQIEALGRVLLIESWDEDKRAAVVELIERGHAQCIDRFLEQLGVEVRDVITDQD